MILIVDDPDVPCPIDIEVGSAFIEKSEPETMVTFAQDGALGDGQPPQ